MRKWKGDEHDRVWLWLFGALKESVVTSIPSSGILGWWKQHRMFWTLGRVLFRVISCTYGLLDCTSDKTSAGKVLFRMDSKPLGASSDCLKGLWRTSIIHFVLSRNFVLGQNHTRLNVCVLLVREKMTLQSSLHNQYDLCFLAKPNDSTLIALASQISSQRQWNRNMQ